MNISDIATKLTMIILWFTIMHLFVLPKRAFPHYIFCLFFLIINPESIFIGKCKDSPVFPYGPPLYSNEYYIDQFP